MYFFPAGFAYASGLPLSFFKPYLIKQNWISFTASAGNLSCRESLVLSIV